MSYAPYLHWGKKAEEREGERERHPHRFAEHLKFQVHGKGREDAEGEREGEGDGLSPETTAKDALVHWYTSKERVSDKMPTFATVVSILIATRFS